MNVRIALFGSALTITALLGPAIAVGENPIVPDEIADVRSNRAKLFEPKLTVRMNILKLGHGRAVRVTPKVAVDATGKSLVDPKIEVRWNRLTALAKSKWTTARGAKTLRELSGTHELYDSGADPNSIVTLANGRGRGRGPQTLVNPVLKAANLQINVLNKAQIK